MGSSFHIPIPFKIRELTNNFPLRWSMKVKNVRESRRRRRERKYPKMKKKKKREGKRKTNISPFDIFFCSPRRWQRFHPTCWPLRAKLDFFARHKQIVAPFTAVVRDGRCRRRCGHTWRRSKSSRSKNSPATCEFILFRVTQWRSTRVSRVSCAEYDDRIENKRFLSLIHFVKKTSDCSLKILRAFLSSFTRVDRMHEN